MIMMSDKEQKLFLTRELPTNTVQSEEQDFIALNLLSHSVLETACHEAADEHELAAHLEALGYNNDRTKEEFGLSNTFELASELFKHTNSQTKPNINLNSLSDLQNQQAVLIFAIIVTIFAFLNESINWATMLWIISWSFMGSYLLSQSPKYWSKKEEAGILTATLYIGLLGFLLMNLFFGFKFFSVTVAIFWWTIVGWIWRQKIYEEVHILSGLMPSFLLLLSMIGGIVFDSTPWPAFTCFLMLALAFFLARHELIWPKMETWYWITKYGLSTFLMGLYGLGQGLLFVSLIDSAKEVGIYWSLLGLALFTILIMVAQHLVLWLKDALAKLMWSDNLLSRKHFYRFVETIVLRYSLLPTLALLAVLLLANYDSNNDFSNYMPIIGFVLLGISLSFALALVSINDTKLAQISFAIAGLLSLTGLPINFLLICLVILLFGRLLIYSRHIEQYGIFLSLKNPLASSQN